MNVINDFIHMTQGQLLLSYWWVWSIIIVVAGVYMVRNQR